LIVEKEKKEKEKKKEYYEKMLIKLIVEKDNYIKLKKNKK
jgi:hypothetical protein